MSDEYKIERQILAAGQASAGLVFLDPEVLGKIIEKKDFSYGRHLRALLEAREAIWGTSPPPGGMPAPEIVPRLLGALSLAYLCLSGYAVDFGKDAAAVAIEALFVDMGIALPRGEAEATYPNDLREGR